MIGDPKKDPKKHRRSPGREGDIAVFTMNTTASANEMTGAVPSIGNMPVGFDGPLELFPDLTTDPEDD